jgi:hypothetical protein
MGEAIGNIPPILPAPAGLPVPAAKPIGKRKVIDSLGQFFLDTDGKPSATRLVMILWATGTLAIWAYASIKTATLAELPNSVVEILGVLLTGKVVQKFGETAAGGN